MATKPSGIIANKCDVLPHKTLPRVGHHPIELDTDCRVPTKMKRASPTSCAWSCAFCALLQQLHVRVSLASSGEVDHAYALLSSTNKALGDQVAA
eukprot:2966623-Amphidinium_carterae.1